MNDQRRTTAATILLALLKAGCYLLLFLGCQMAVTMVIAITFAIVAMITGDSTLFLEQVMNYATHITFFAAILTLVFLVVFFLVRRKKPLYEAGLARTAPRMVAIAAVLAPGFYAVVITVLGFLPEAWLESYAEASSSLSTTGILAFLATVIAAPLVEEVIFRGLILSRLNRIMPGWLAVVVSALVFGLCHGQAVWVAYASLLGLFFGWIALRSKSILPTLVAHIVFNAIGHFSAYFEDAMTDGIFLIFIAALLVISVIGCLLARRGLADLFRRNPAQPKIPPDAT